MRYVWLLPIAGALRGAFWLWTIQYATTAPQQAAAASMAAAWAVVPYVIARAIDEQRQSWTRASEKQRRREKIAAIVVGVLATAFVIAVAVSSYLRNRDLQYQGDLAPGSHVLP